MALIDLIKPRIGVFYSTPDKDAEIQSMINSATAYFFGAGWRFTADQPPPLAVEAVALYCKMAQSTDPAAFDYRRLTPFILQGRSGNV